MNKIKCFHVCLCVISNKFRIFLIKLFCVCVICIYLWIIYISGFHRGQKRLLESLALELNMIVNHLLTARTEPGSFQSKYILLITQLSFHSFSFFIHNWCHYDILIMYILSSHLYCPLLCLSIPVNLPLSNYFLHNFMSFCLIIFWI